MRRQYGYGAAVLALALMWLGPAAAAGQETVSVDVQVVFAPTGAATT